MNRTGFQPVIPGAAKPPWWPPKARALRRPGAASCDGARKNHEAVNAIPAAKKANPRTIPRTLPAAPWRLCSVPPALFDFAWFIGFLSRSSLSLAAGPAASRHVVSQLRCGHRPHTTTRLGCMQHAVELLWWVCAVRGRQVAHRAGGWSPQSVLRYSVHPPPR